MKKTGIIAGFGGASRTGSCFFINHSLQKYTPNGIRFVDVFLSIKKIQETKLTRIAEINNTKEICYTIWTYQMLLAPPLLQQATPTLSQKTNVFPKTMEKQSTIYSTPRSQPTLVASIAPGLTTSDPGIPPLAIVMAMYRCQFPYPVVCTVVMNRVEMGEHFGRHTGCYTMRCYKCNTSFVSIDVYKEHKDWCHPTPSDVEAYQTPDKLHLVHENCYRHFVVPATSKEIADGRGVVQWHLYQNGHQQLQELHDFQKAHSNQVGDSGYQGYQNPYGTTNGPQLRNSASGVSYNPYQNQRHWNPNRGGWNHRGWNRGGRGGSRFHSRGASWRPLVSNQDGEKENDQNREQPSTPTRPARPPTPFTSPGELAPLQIVSPPDTPTQASGTEGFPLAPVESPVDKGAPQAAEPTLPSPDATEPAPESAQASPVDAIPLPSGTENVPLLLTLAATPTADFEAQSEELSAPAKQNYQDVAVVAQALPNSEIPLPPPVAELAPTPSPVEADLEAEPEELSAPAEQHQDVAIIGKAPDSSEASVHLPLEVVPPQSPLEAELAEQDALSAHGTSLPQPVAEVVLPSPIGLAADLAVQSKDQLVPTEKEVSRASETLLSPLAELVPPPSPSLPASLTVQAEQDALFVPPSPSPAANFAVRPEEQPTPDEPLPPQAGNVPESQPRDQSDEDDVVFVCEVKKGKAPRPSPAADIAVQPEEQPAPDEPLPPQTENVPEPQPRDRSDEDDDVVFVCEVEKAPRPPLPPPPPAPKIHPPHVIINLGPLPELPMPPPMSSPNENFPSPTAKNGPPAWLRCKKWTDLKEKLSPELEAQLTPDQRRGYIGSLWTEHPEPATGSPPVLHDDSQLSPGISEGSEAPAPSHPVQQKSSGSYHDYHHLDFIGQVRIEIDADGIVQVHGEFSQDESQGLSRQKSSGNQEKCGDKEQRSPAERRHGAQTPKRYEDPDRQLTPTPSSQNTHTPSYRDTLGSPVLSSPEGSPPAPVSSKPRSSKSSQEVEYRQFVAKKTEKRLSTSSIPSVPPPVKKVATTAPAKTPVQNDNIFDSILDVMSSPQGPTILGVERKELAPTKVKGPNFMAKKGFTFGKK